MKSSNLTCLFISLLMTFSFVSMSQGVDLRSIIAQATRGFRDITLTCRVTYANQAELRKIGKDFGKSYEFKTTTVYFKAPDKMKIEGKLGMVGAKIVMNGNRKATVIPALRISKKEDVSDEPHKRQTDLDLGIVTDSLWRDYRVLSVSSEKVVSKQIYRVVFVRENAREKRHVAWIDGEYLKLLKLEKYESDGGLKARYLYSNHTLVGGVVWVPRRVDVYSPDGKLAGTSVYENISVNTNIPDSEFAL